MLNLKSIIHNLKSNHGFTLMELLIVIAIIVVLAVSIIVLLNPFKQIGKSWDAKRKQELSGMQKSFTDYYNDKNSYPTGDEVCYTSVIDDAGVCSCFICGSVSNQPSSLPPYLNRIPCDPQHGTTDYLYQYDCDTNQWFKIYALLSENNQATGYDYGVSSGNVPIEPYPSTTITPTSNPPPGATSTPSPTSNPDSCPTDVYLFCTQSGNENQNCNGCGLLENCKTGGCDQDMFYTDNQCLVPCQP